jgi:adenosine deaminase
MELDKKLLKALPKTDLHCHLDGSLRLDTIIDIARKENIDIPTMERERLAELVVVGPECNNLVEYLSAFDITTAVLQSPEALYRTAFELAEDAAEENVRYLEVRYSPILHTHKGVKLTEIVDSVIEGLKEAEKKYNILTGVLVSGLRHTSPDMTLKLAELAVAYKNKGVVGFDLAGAEDNFPAKHHKEAFYLILNNNINCTVHAGEAYGPESIHQALHYLGAHRIGHGTRLKEDGDLLNYVNDHRIPLEVCLTSNIHTKAAASFEQHPLRFYYDYGLRVTLNTDNRLISDTNMTEEMYRASKYLNFDLNEIKDIILSGFKSAFIPNRTKALLLNLIAEELNRF